MQSWVRSSEIRAGEALANVVIWFAAHHGAFHLLGGCLTHTGVCPIGLLQRHSPEVGTM